MENFGTGIGSVGFTVTVVKLARQDEFSPESVLSKIFICVSLVVSK